MMTVVKIDNDYFIDGNDTFITNRDIINILIVLNLQVQVPMNIVKYIINNDDDAKQFSTEIAVKRGNPNQLISGCFGKPSIINDLLPLNMCDLGITIIGGCFILICASTVPQQCVFAAVSKLQLW